MKFKAFNRMLATTITLKPNGTCLSETIVGPPSPGEIRSDTFDPASGALKIQIVVRDDGTTLVPFDPDTQASRDFTRNRDSL